MLSPPKRDYHGPVHSFRQCCPWVCAASDGTFITFDAPGAGTAAHQGTMPFSINPAGTIPGNYIEASSVNHGFVRDKPGGLTQRSMLPARAQVPARAPSPLPTTSRGRSSDTTLMRAVSITASSWKASRPCERVWIAAARRRQRDTNIAGTIWFRL